MANWFHFSLTAVVLLCCVYERVADDHHWDYFVFTQEWPVSMCLFEKEKHQKCVVPHSVQTWTIHGLWPNQYFEEEPNFCNSTWKFNPKQIASLLDNLETYWPNLFPDSSKYGFWSHEWEKHGTCSTTLQATANEFLYFNTTLRLQQRFSLVNILKSKGVVPRDDKQYSLHQVFDIVKEQLGAAANITCVHYHKKYYLGQIQICLNKQFKPLDCGTVFHAGNSTKSTHSYFKDCPKDSEKDDIYYPLPPSW